MVVVSGVGMVSSIVASPCPCPRHMALMRPSTVDRQGLGPVLGQVLRLGPGPGPEAGDRLVVWRYRSKREEALVSVLPAPLLALAPSPSPVSPSLTPPSDPPVTLVAMVDSAACLAIHTFFFFNTPPSRREWA